MHFRHLSHIKTELISKLKQILFTSNHFKFGVTIASASASYALITRFLTSSSKEPATSDHDGDGHRARINKQELFIRTAAVMVSMCWLKALPKEFREMVVLHLFVRAVYDLVKL